MSDLSTSLSEKSIIVTGIRPTGDLHLGNYFGAIRQLLTLQKQYKSYFFIADLHSLTTHPDTSELSRHSCEVLASIIACGLDPKQAVVYLQSDLPEVLELYYYLNSLAFLGELEKTPSFKEKARKQPQNVNVALLTYPTLMAADILLHRANFVPIGKDQQAHLELCRDLAHRFNGRYGELFTLPQAYKDPELELLSIRSLDGNGKMSKSENNNATIYLTDSDEMIRQKIMKAKTDSGDGVRSESVDNLLQLLALSGAQDAYAHFSKNYLAGTLRYSELKGVLADSLIALIARIRTRRAEILADPNYIAQILDFGAEEARTSAKQTLTELRKSLKFRNFQI